jgi:predicted O-methyltransferase YrrM
MNRLPQDPVRPILDRLFAAAAIQEERPTLAPTDGPITTMSAQERADALATAYMPVSASGGRLLYALVRATRPETVVEFGTSFAISTIHLGAAVADNSIGHVFTTELSLSKVRAARANLAEARLADYVTVLPGDALETLATIPGPIGVVLLDGWKDLCLPVLKSLEDRLAPGTLVIADDTAFPSMREYLAYVRDPLHGYVSVDFPVEDGMEISCRG